MSAGEPRVVVLTGDGPEHRFVANRIAAAVPVAAVLVLDPPPRRRPLALLSRAPLRFADKAAWRLFLRASGDARARERALARVLGPDSADFHMPERLERVGLARGPGLLAALDRLAPDIIAVYGTGIVPDAALARAREVALNMHTGLSPWYRGTACAFWPIHEGEPERVGATVHRCTAAVDGGEIFFAAPAPPRRGDDLHAVFARAVLVGAEGYVRVLREALAGGLAGTPQDLALGREYRGAMRGLASELRARRRLRRMQPQLPDP